MIPKIGKIANILRISTRPLKNIPQLLILPIIQVCVGLIVLLFMLTMSIHIVTIGDIDRIDYNGVPGGEIKIIEYYVGWRYILIFIVPICFLWLSIIVTIGEFICASSSSIWFFSKEKTALQSPIYTSINNLFRYHFGTIVLASIVLPIFRSLKAVLGFMKGELRGNRDCCSKCLTNTCCGCLNLHEMFFRYLNSDLLPFLAVWGDEFMISGRRTYFLKKRANQNTKPLSSSGNFLIWMCTLVISLSGPTFTLYWIVYEDETFANEQVYNITSALGPAVISLIACIFIAEVFAGVFRGSMNSSIICYLTDVELFEEINRFSDNEYSSKFQKVDKDEMKKPGNDLY
jgi:hypothetical protein